MEKIIKLLPWIFICLTLTYVLFRYEKNNNLAKDYYVIEGMTFYLILCTFLAIIFKLDIFILSTGGILFGIIIGSFLKRGKYY